MYLYGIFQEANHHHFGAVAFFYEAHHHLCRQGKNQSSVPNRHPRDVMKKLSKSRFTWHFELFTDYPLADLDFKISFVTEKAKLAHLTQIHSRLCSS